MSNSLSKLTLSSRSCARRRRICSLTMTRDDRHWFRSPYTVLLQFTCEGDKTKMRNREQALSQVHATYQAHLLKYCFNLKLSRPGIGEPKFEIVKKGRGD